LIPEDNFIDVFLARHVSGAHAHHQEILSCTIWFSAPSFWVGGGPESFCVGRVCGADGIVLVNYDNVINIQKIKKNM